MVAFFVWMPADSDPGMAFVLEQHLAPDHKSILADIVSRFTRMPVFEVEDGMKMQPNCVYVIPPSADLALVNGELQISEPMAQRGRRLPIDFFFRSLAQYRQGLCTRWGMRVDEAASGEGSARPLPAPLLGLQNAGNRRSGNGSAAAANRNRSKAKDRHDHGER